MNSSVCPLTGRGCCRSHTRGTILMVPQSDHQPDEPEESYQLQNPEHLGGVPWPGPSESSFLTKRNAEALQGLRRIRLGGWAQVMLSFDPKPAPLKCNAAKTAGPGAGIQGLGQLRATATRGCFVNVAPHTLRIVSDFFSSSH